MLVCMVCVACLMGSMLACVARVAILRGQHASVGGILTCVA